MNVQQPTRIAGCRLGLICLCVAGLAWLVPAGAPAADPTFVGALALVDEPEVVKELKLSDKQKQDLVALLESREADALELAMEFRDLTPGERAEKLAPFRRESEEKGLALLTAEQQAQLKRIRIRLLGMGSLADETVASRLDLTDDQKSAVAKLLREREDRLAVTSKDRTHIVRAEIERKLAGLLSEKQTAAWEALIADAGGQAGAPEPEASPATSPEATPAVAPEATAKAGSEASAKAEPEAAAKTEPEAAAKAEAPSAPGAEAAKPADAAGPAKSEAAPGETPLAQRPSPFPDDPKGRPAAPVVPARDGISVKTPADVKPGEAPAAPPAADAKLRFSFRYQPWKDVLDWFAQQAGLSLVMEDPPKGTFNYTDDKDYTPAQAIDLLNSVLQTKGFVLVRRNRMLFVINTENPIHPLLIDTIPVEDLDGRGSYELVTVAFQLQKLTPEEIEGEVRKMTGPGGSVVPLSKSKQILVTETAGRLKAIRRAIERADDPEGQRAQLRQYDLQYADAAQILPTIRQFLDIPPEQAASADGAIKVMLDPSGKKYLVSGKDDKVARFTEVLKMLDVPENKAKDGLDQTPQLEVYTVTPADPQSVLAVIQTLLAGSPDARLALDPKTGNLVALCKPADHATIKGTLQQMQPDPRKIEVIQLYSLDPQTAASSIKKLFGIGETPDPNKPQVDADIVAKTLMVVATEPQMEQIKALLEKMGESGAGEAGLGRGGNVRTVPLTGRTAQSALERAQEIWPTMHKNRIRVVTPSAVIPTLRPGSAPETPENRRVPDDPLDLFRGLLGPGVMDEMLPRGDAPAEKPATRIIHPRPLPAPAEAPVPEPKPAPPAAVPLKQTTAPPAEGAGARDRTALRVAPGAMLAAPVLLASQLAVPAPGEGASGAANEGAGGAPEKPRLSPDGELPVIVVAPGTSGIMIASEDLEALDAFEDLLNMLAANAPESDVTVFYLKHAKAEAVAETLDRIFGVSSSGGGGGGGGGGGFLGSIANAAMGDAGGGILGSLLGLGGPGGGGGGVAPSGTIQITPDPRLNALVVQANAKDTDMVEQLLKILDQEKGPEPVAVQPKARVIPVVNMAAEDVADMIRQSYSDRLITGGAGGAQRQPSPQELIQMLRGGSGRRGGGAGGSADIQQKMSVSVDSRNNSLIVVAPDQLFEEVKQLVEQLDGAARESNQTMQVIALKNANPAAVEQALAALVGQNVQFGRTGATGRTQRPTTPGQAQPAQPQQPPMQGLQQQIEQFRSQFQQSPGSRPGASTRGGTGARGARGGR